MSRTRRPPSRSRRSSNVRAQPDGEQDPATRDAGPRSLARRIYGGIAGLGVIIGVAVGGLQFVDALEKRVKDEPPARIAPQITEVRHESTGETLLDYLEETRQPSRSFSREQLKQPGFVFDVGVRIVGLVDEPYELRWSMYERRDSTAKRLRGDVYNQVAAEFVPKSSDHLTDWPVWVPYPPNGGTYVVRFTLVDDRGLPVDRMNSPDVRHAARAGA